MDAYGQVSEGHHLQTVCGSHWLGIGHLLSGHQVGGHRQHTSVVKATRGHNFLATVDSITSQCHGVALQDVYVASVCLEADYKQVVKAFTEAEAHKGVSVIVAYAPCTMHVSVKSADQLQLACTCNDRAAQVLSFAAHAVSILGVVSQRGHCICVSHPRHAERWQGWQLC